MDRTEAALGELVAGVVVGQKQLLLKIGGHEGEVHDLCDPRGGQAHEVGELVHRVCERENGLGSDVFDEAKTRRIAK